jgi:hypothetical protein
MLPSESLGSYLVGAEASRPSLRADLECTYACKRTQTPARADTHAHCDARTHKRTSHMRAFAQARSLTRTHAHAFAKQRESHKHGRMLLRGDSALTRPLPPVGIMVCARDGLQSVCSP